MNIYPSADASLQRANKNYRQTSGKKKWIKKLKNKVIV